MGQILNFPTKKIEPVTVRSRQKHRIAVEIFDGVRARRTRWIVQFEIQEAAGYGAVKGFKDAAVAVGYRHRFWVGGTRPCANSSRRRLILSQPEGSRSGSTVHGCNRALSAVHEKMGWSDTCRSSPLSYSAATSWRSSSSAECAGRLV
jgi:hypothetical protein